MESGFIVKMAFNMEMKLDAIHFNNIKNGSKQYEARLFDEKRQKITTKVINEKPLTIFLNSHEIVTLMSIGDHPKYLAIGYLLNQNMIKIEEKIKKIEYQKDLETIIIRTNKRTNYEKKLRKKITTSGCAQGTIFGDIYDELENLKESLEKLSKVTSNNNSNGIELKISNLS